MNVLVASPSLSWTIFRDIIKYKSSPKTSKKWHSFFHGVHSHIVRCRLVSKMLERPFSGPCLFSFHDLKHIVEAYLDDFASRSHKRTDHPTHLQLIFEHFHYFWIRSNPNKCNFCITSRRLLGFIVSTTRIMVDPLKVEAIIQLC